MVPDRVGHTDPSPEVWEVRGGAMQEDGLHGVDGYDVWKADERADDSFFQDHGDAQEMADRLNEENAEPVLMPERVVHNEIAERLRRGEATNREAEAPLPASASAEGERVVVVLTDDERTALLILIDNELAQAGPDFGPGPATEQLLRALRERIGEPSSWGRNKR